MELKDMGEFPFIEQMSQAFLKTLPRGVVGIGDDCAIIPWREDKSLLVSTDLLLEEVHFLSHAISPFDLGYKSLAVNISDVAAMGGRPLYAFLSLAVPPNIQISWLNDFFAGLGELAQEQGVFLLGGDTTRSQKQILINVTILGEAHSDKIKRRNTARVGDIIAVTAPLGGSAAGLHVIVNEMCQEKYRSWVEQHHRPRPTVADGQFLAGQSGVHAMMDLSDGLSSDIARICGQSAVGALIELEKVPFDLELKKFADSCAVNLWDWTVAGGEDYALLLTVAADEFEKIAYDFQQKFGRPLFAVGTITSADSGIVYQHHGMASSYHPRGFQHFASGEKK